MSDYPAIPFPDELVHLEQVSARLSDALQQAEASVRRADREYADTKNTWRTTGEKSIPMRCSRMNCC